MAIDLECLSTFLSDFIDELPTEVTFRNQTINVRIGEATRMRDILIAGIQPGQSMECLIKREDCATDPTTGETITISDTGYKITTVTPLLSLSEPSAYRLTLTRKI